MGCVGMALEIIEATGVFHFIFLVLKSLFFFFLKQISVEGGNGRRL